MFERDDLSGLSLGDRFRWFVLPAKLILWLLYMFPSSGSIGTRQSSRWARSPIITLIVAIIFWLTVIGFLVAILLSGQK